MLAKEFNTELFNKKIGNLKLLNVQEFAELIDSTNKSVYTRLSRKLFPKYIYIKIGRRPLFIESRVEEWILTGAPLNKQEREIL